MISAYIDGSCVMLSRYWIGDGTLSYTSVVEINDTSYTEDVIEDLDNQLCSENNELKLLDND